VLEPLMRRRPLPRDQPAGALGLHGQREQLPNIQGDRGATGPSWRPPEPVRVRGIPLIGQDDDTGRSSFPTTSAEHSADQSEWHPRWRPSECSTEVLCVAVERVDRMRAGDFAPDCVPWSGVTPGP